MKKLNVNIGSIVYFEDEKSKVIKIVDMNSVMINIFTTSEKKIVSLSQLHSTPLEAKEPEWSYTVEFTDVQLKEATRRYEIIKPLLQLKRTGDMVKKVAEKENVNFTTLYEWIKSYETSGVLTALVPRYDQRGGKGKSRINSETELIVQQVINDLYLHKQKLTPKQIYMAIKQKCKNARLTPPHENTVRNRINALADQTVLSMRESRRRAERLYHNTDGKYPMGKYPLDSIQIDHTPIDLMIVDEQDREEIGRPYLTLAIDVYSRMIVGYYISLEEPSYLSVSQCISQMILKKDSVLLEHHVKGSWNVWGIPRAIHLDNAQEFRSINLQRNCEQFGISIDWRAVARPQFGAHIERLIGTSMNEVHTLPGTTFSNIAERGEYNSGKEAVMTMSELEDWYCEYIVNVYNYQLHSALNTTPAHQFEIGILGDENTLGRGIPEVIEDEDYLHISFLPTEERSIQQTGVSIDKIFYYHDVLRKWIRAKNKDGSTRKFIFKIDLRDISSIWFFDPELKQFFEIPYRNITNPRISRRDLIRAKRYLAEKKYTNYDEDQIFIAYDAMKKIRDDSSNKTKTARKEREIQQTNQRKTKRPSASKVSAKDEKYYELFKNVKAFDEIEIGRDND